MSMLLPIFYFISAGLFVLYSYTQIDLSLTLSRAGFLQELQAYFQHIGFFNRPLSTVFYIGLLLLFFSMYAYMLIRAYKKSVKLREFQLIIVILSVVTLFAYPAFSYDFFNYLFTAKTLLIYHKNPYMVIPLQFSGIDPWLSFMHWTHLPSAYTPLWILSTIVPYLFGFGYLILLIWNLKVYLTISYIAAVYGIGKILEKSDKNSAITGMIIFGLNPLIITECLISPHNDIVMMAIAIWAIILYEKKQKLASWFVLSLSVAMKLMTIFLIPAFFYRWNKKLSLVCMLLGFIAVLTQREVLSWYWVWILPFIALIPEAKNFTIMSFGISLGLLLRYAPFIYFGHWDPPVSMLKTYVTVAPVIGALLWVSVRKILRRK